MTLGFGLVGAGLMGRTYAYAIRELVPEARLVAVHGGSGAAALAASSGAALAGSVEDLVRRPDVDAVIVASPTFRHREHVVAAATAGRHVFCETPLATTLDDVDAILSAVEGAGVVLAVEAVSRYRTGVRRAHDLIADGAIGRVQMLRFTNAHPVGGHHGMAPWMADSRAGTFFVDQGSHSNDVLRWFADSEASLVYAAFGTFAGGQPNASAMVTITFASGAIAQTWASDEFPAAPAARSSEYLVVGSQGLVEVQLRGTLRLNRGSGWELLYEHPEIGIDPPTPDYAYPYADQLRDFVGAIQTGRRPEVDGRAARRALEISLAADRSAATRTAVALPLDGVAGPS